jgi:carboxylesterase type B
MKAASWQKLMEGVNKVGILGGATSLLSFWPVWDNKTIFKDIHERQESGKFMKRVSHQNIYVGKTRHFNIYKPMIIGNNNNEAGVVSGFALTAVEIIKKNLQPIPDIVKIVIDSIEWLRDGTGIVVDSVRGILHFMEDGVFNCPAGTAAAARAKFNVPVWRYRYMGTFENTLISGQGAYHLSEIPIVLGTVERKKTAARNSPEQEQTIKNTMSAWAAFAKDPEHGLDKVGWPKYNPNCKFRLDLFEFLTVCLTLHSGFSRQNCTR